MPEMWPFQKASRNVAFSKVFWHEFQKCGLLEVFWHGKMLFSMYVTVWRVFSLF